MDTIVELFALDPLELTKRPDSDFEKIIEYYRQRRFEYQATGKAPKEVPKPVDLKKIGLL